MNGVQLRALIGASLVTNVRRLTFWVFAAVFVTISIMLSRGGVSFAGMSASGVKLATNAEYAIAAMLGAFSFFLMHFTATMCGDPITQDFRLGVAPILRSSPLQVRTYVLGRFLGGYLSLLSIYAVFVAALMLGQLLPASEDRLTLDFRVLPYLKHALWFVVVPTFFVGATSFMIGTLTRNMRMAYIFVTALLVGWFLVLLMLGDDNLRRWAYFEPSGQVWLAEKIARSRGNAWLNENPISIDFGFLINRLVLLAIGFASLAFTVWRFPKIDDSEVGVVKDGYITRMLRWFARRDATVEDRYANWVGRTAVPVVEPSPRGFGLWCAQFWSSLVTETRLLLAERSLWIMAPVIMLVAGAAIASFEGPFNLPLYPVSSEYAQHMVGPLLMFLAGTTIFYTGEVFHRDDANSVRSIIYATPVPNGALLFAKLFAMIVLSVGMALLTAATAMLNQVVRWAIIHESPHVEFTPYFDLGLHVILPSIVAMCAIALFVNVLLRGRYLAYFALIALGAAYVWWAIVKGHRSLLWNPMLVGHVRYSDLVRLEPFESTLRLHHAYWGLVLFAALALSTWILERTQGGWKNYVSLAAIARRPMPVAFATLSTIGAVFVALEITRQANVRGTESEFEAKRLELEDKYFADRDEPRLTYQRIDIDVKLRPEERALDVKGNLTLVNAWPKPIRTVYFTIDPLYTIRKLELDGASLPYARDDAVIVFALDKPLASGEHTTLHLDWSGVINPGLAKNGGPQSTFIHPSSVFVNSFAPEVVPVPGISSSLFLDDEAKRKDHGRGPLHVLTDRSNAAFVPSMLWADSAYDFRARIEAPKPLEVLSVGRPGPVEDLGATQRFTWESDGPVRSFAIVANLYDAKKNGGDQVFYHHSHSYNVDTIMRALDDSRRTFSASFVPYPYEQLKIAEFPRLADFAESFPTLMPYSESIGFLTNFRDADNARYVDANYFVTSHEVAHQWWAYLLHPGMSLGSQVLTESLAEYSAMVLIDQQRSERMRLVFVKNEEDRYLRGRNPDKEVPLASLENEGGVYWYNKGSHVFYMLERMIGRERLLAGLRSFVQVWQKRASSPQPTFPTVHDLIATLQNQHRNQNLDWFYDQWFEKVVVPDLVVDSANLRRSGDAWTIDFKVSNVGKGRAVVHAEAIAGKWDLTENTPPTDFRASAPIPLSLDAGQSVQGSLTCAFEPSKLIVDRLFECIDFDRTNNTKDLERVDSPSTGVQASAPPSRQN